MRRTLIRSSWPPRCSSRRDARDVVRGRARTPPLRGTNWVLTDRVSLGTPLDGVAVDAVFDGKRVTGSSGCNGYNQLVHTNGPRMTIDQRRRRAR